MIEFHEFLIKLLFDKASLANRLVIIIIINNFGSEYIDQILHNEETNLTRESYENCEIA